MRSDRYKYIRRYDKRQAPVLSNIDDGFAKSELVAAGFAERPPAPEQLYDTLLDPRRAQTTSSMTLLMRRCWRICARGSSAGCTKQTTRYCRAMCPRRPAASSTAQMLLLTTTRLIQPKAATHHEPPVCSSRLNTTAPARRI